MTAIVGAKRTRPNGITPRSELLQRSPTAALQNRVIGNMPLLKAYEHDPDFESERTSAMLG
ncbi:hypothetical protein CU102_04050 [Phyllobacterium brassicacearum]|uniref:Uncharacterized protein n=1 Tax=Phyllobacterium brassicacearum TaxID=314235 RepID=A0A2P7BV27_9HYPH|nr:hypothetical protein CU102_04050 [Phyllobacterium brassicacearum]